MDRITGFGPVDRGSNPRGFIWFGPLVSFETGISDDGEWSDLWLVNPKD